MPIMKSKTHGHNVTVGKAVGDGHMVTSQGATSWWSNSQIKKFLTTK